MSSETISSFINNFTTPDTSKAKDTYISRTGKILIGLSGGLAIGLSVICYPFVAPAFRKHCLPYVPATQKQLNNVLLCINEPTVVKNKILDIGSGDGRIVIAAAKNGYEAHGVELNPWLVQYSRVASLANGVFWNTKFYKKDLWKFNVQPYNYIVIFGVEQMMLDLERKLMNEVSMQTKIIACRFPFPNFVPERVVEDGIHSVWLYDGSKMRKKAEAEALANNMDPIIVTKPPNPLESPQLNPQPGQLKQQLDLKEK